MSRSSRQARFRRFIHGLAAMALGVGVLAGLTAVTVLPTSSPAFATAPPLSVTTTSLPPGTVGNSYSATLAAAGGTTPYTWALISGSLPAGLSLSVSSGAITGTPTASATSSFTMLVTDSSSPAETATTNLSITVLLPLSVKTTALPSGTVGNSYSATLAAAGGTTPYTWALISGSLPAGLNLDASSGAITGTPSASATSSFTVTVTDSSSPTQTTSANLSITVSPPGFSVTTTSLPSGTVGSSYSVTLAAIDGTTPYSWALTSGSLPAGLSLSGSSGAITGTPTALGTSSFTVTATDSSSPAKTATTNLSITVSAPPLSVTTTFLPSGIVGVAYSATLAATGGITPYTWALTSGSLPAGLSLNASSGAITGTPSASGSSGLTVLVTDSSSPAKSASASLSITVAFSVTTTSLPSGVVGNSYSATLAAAGGTTPYTWAVTSGSLPAGLSLSASSGAITGTPSTTGTSSFTVTVTDSSSPAKTASANLSITILPPVSISTTSLPGATFGSSYSATIAATGGITPYTWAITSGSLPAGLSLSASSGAITGTPTATGTSSFTVTVTDSSSPAKTASANLSIKVSATVPGAPTALSAVAGNTQVALSWTTPASNGGSAITGYDIYKGTSPGAESATPLVTGVPGTSDTVIGLTNRTTYYFTVEAVNAVGNSAPSNEASATPAAPLSVTTTYLPGGTVGSSYSATIAATGGITPYTWKVTSGSLPAGLSLNASSGIIAGTPTATGTSSFNVTVTDSSSPAKTASATLSITVSATVPGAPTALGAVAGNNQVVVSWTAPASNGGSAITGYDVYKGTSPGAESATPVATGVPGTTYTVSGLTNGTTYYFTVEAVNVVGNSAPSNEASATPAPQLSVSTTSLPAGGVGSSYSATLVATNGTAPTPGRSPVARFRQGSASMPPAARSRARQRPQGPRASR